LSQSQLLTVLSGLKNWPLPLGAIYNLRVLVSLCNLVDLIIKCINHPSSKSNLYGRDGRDLFIYIGSV
jgi:hypothetical protein